MDQTDRWVTEGDSPGYLKVVHLPNGKLLGGPSFRPGPGKWSKNGRWPWTRG
jgi:hypothetical protein